MDGNEFLNLFDVTRRSLVAAYTCFGVIFCLHLQGENVCEVVDISASTQRSADLKVIIITEINYSGFDFGLYYFMCILLLLVRIFGGCLFFI